MEKLGGLTILLSLLLLCIAAYGWFAGSADAFSTAVTGVLLLGLGTVMAIRPPLARLIGVLAILAGLVVLVWAVSQLVTGGPNTALAGVAVIAVLIGGVYLVKRRVSDPKVAPGTTEATVPEAGPPAETDPPAETAPAQAIFSVVQTGDDRALNRVERLLQGDPRITDIIAESGQWYASPDRDDLPEWHALRVYCAQDEIDQVMAESERRVASKLGQSTAAKVSFSRYS
ncbi:MAG: DUF308 domain-containing protein [Paracoccaceae bacterium]